MKRSRILQVAGSALFLVGLGFIVWTLFMRGELRQYLMLSSLLSGMSLIISGLTLLINAATQKMMEGWLAKKKYGDDYAEERDSG